MENMTKFQEKSVDMLKFFGFRSGEGYFEARCFQVFYSSFHLFAGNYMVLADNY